MKKVIFKELLHGIMEFAKKRSPEILTGIGVAGMISGTVFAIKNTPKALTLIEEEKGRQKVEKLDAASTIRVTWKCYIPTIAIETVSVACLVGSTVINTKRNTALTLAYGISEAALREYQDKVVDTLGEKSEKKVYDAIAKDRVEKYSDVDSEVIYTGKGDTLCFDDLSKRYFKSDREKIRKAINDANEQIIDEDYISLNEFYSWLNLPKLHSSIGETMGWNVRKGKIDPAFSTQLAQSGTPCLVLLYRMPPYYGYEKL